MSNQQQQPPRPALGLDQYVDTLAFQSYSLMQLQMAMATKDQQIQQLAQQLADSQAKLKDATDQLNAYVQPGVEVRL